MSWSWASILLAGCFLSLALGSASAQSDNPFFRIRSQDAQNKTILKDLGSAELHFNVSVEPQSATPLSERFLIQLEARMEPVVPPNGFGMTISSPGRACPDRGSCTVSVAPGEQVRFVVTVTNTITDPDQPSVTVTLKYRSTPQFRDQPNNPVAAALVQQMSQSHTAEAKGSVALNLNAAEKLTSFVKRYPLFVLLAAGGIFVLGVVLVKKRRGGIAVSTDAPFQQVLPGRGASFPLQVVNEGRQKQSLSLTTSGVPHGWSVVLPVERIELGSNETTTIWMTVKASANAQPGQHVQVNFVATSAEGETAETLVETVVVDQYGASPRGPEASSDEAAPLEAAAPQQAPVREARVTPKRRKA